VNPAGIPIVVPVVGSDELQVDMVRRAVGIAVLAQGAVLAALVLTGAVGPVGLGFGAVYGLVCDLLILRGLSRAGSARVGVANAITWARCAVVGAVVALAAGSSGPPPPLELAVAATVALVLDGVDGRVARVTGTTSEFGSRFDMEVDASLVLALSVAVTPRLGPWILLVGAARYLLLLATLLMPRLAEPTPARLWRKAVAVVQGVVLTAICTGWLAPPLDASVALAAALALAWSFGTQIHGLLRTELLTVTVAPQPVDAQRG
jgi:phosphatidylglycerophosphate synthase